MREVTGLAEPERAHWQKKGLERLRWALVGYAIALALLGTSAVLGLAPVTPVVGVTALAAITWLVFFGLLSAGKVGPRHDPMWAFPQVAVGFLVVALAFAYVPWTRTVASAWWFVIVVFDLRRMGRWQTRVIALLSTIFPIWSLWIHWQTPGTDFVLHHELVFMALSLTLVPSLFWISSLSRRLGKRLRAQHAQMAQVLARLKRLSAQDALTGLYNRTAMQRMLRREALRTQRNHLTFSVVMIDLDHFKTINDRFGHAVGDEVLRQFGELARKSARARTDAMARWGGEEFLLFLPATTPLEAQACIHRLREAVARHSWFRIHPRLSVTFSAGVAAHDWHATLETTLDLADQALYRAKAQGRDQVCEALTRAQTQPQAPRVATPSPAHTPSEPSNRTSEIDNGWLLTRKPGPQTAPHDTPLQQWLFGRDESLRPWIQLCLIASGLYVSLILAIVAYGVPSGLVSPRWAKVFVSADLIAAFLPLLVVRSGLAKKWNDPGLTLVQILWGCALCALAFLTVPHSRAYDIQLLCVTLVFGLNHLRPNQAVFAGGFVSVMFMGIYVNQTHAALAATDDLALRLQLLMAAAVIWLLTLQMRHHCLIREGVNEEKLHLLSAMEQLRQAIKFDPLTQLYNRPHMNSLLEDESLRHDRTGSGFCVALIDLDHFKSINDGLGHQAGDHVLKRFSACAKQVLRETDTIGRWGGEEFVLLVPDIRSVSQGFKAVERLREVIQSQALCKEDPDRPITFSAGLAVRQPGEPTSALLERADSALYAAKQQGRNRCIISQAA